MEKAFIHVTGYIHNDPKLDRTKNKDVPRLRAWVKSPSRVRDENGNYQNSYQYFEITAFYTVAERIAAHLRSGDPIVVLGTPSSRAYTDKEGNLRSVISVLVESFDFPLKTGSRDKFITEAPQTAHRTQAASQPQQEAQPVYESFDDADIPF
nr:MAG TPA: Single strand binding protein [Caudoviricetes sp.]